MKEFLSKAAEEAFSRAIIVVDHFHVVAYSNRRTNEARKIEQDVLRKKNVKIPRKTFIIGGENLK